LETGCFSVVVPTKVNGHTQFRFRWNGQLAIESGLPPELSFGAWPDSSENENGIRRRIIARSLYYRFQSVLQGLLHLRCPVSMMVGEDLLGVLDTALQTLGSAADAAIPDEEKLKLYLLAQIVGEAPRR